MRHLFTLFLQTMITHACILNKSGSVSRVLRCDKTRQAFENTREICTKHKPQTSVFYISRVFSNVRSVSSQCNTRLRLLHLLYDRFYARKTIKHAFSIFYTLIKNGFLTNQSARWVLATLWKVLKKGPDAGCGKKYKKLIQLLLSCSSMPHTVIKVWNTSTFPKNIAI